MTVTGFSFIRNALKYDFPILESLRSILPVVDKLVVAVGAGEDATRQMVAALDSSKIIIIDTVWDETLKDGGRVLADETNKALRHITWQSDWCLYIQGDEVLHEKYYDALRASMLRWKDDPQVEGLLFDFLHFYGSYQLIGSSSKWYRKEIRVVRNDRDIFSYEDAQGFRKKPNEKLRVKPANATMFHYGWVREPLAMQAKWNNSGGLWNGDSWTQEMNSKRSGPFQYDPTQVLQKFTGTHPVVMRDRIANSHWKFEYEPGRARLPAKERFKNFIQFITGGRRPFDYKNYKEF